MSMLPLTPTAARGNLSELLRRAFKGDDIGIMVDGRHAFLIIATPPMLVSFFNGNHDEIRKLTRSNGRVSGNRELEVNPRAPVNGQS